MELGPDNKTCQIQNFCAKHLKCSQRCEEDKFSVKCSCYEGWELEPDMESCKSTGKRIKWHRGSVIVRVWGGHKEGTKSLTASVLSVKKWRELEVKGAGQKDVTHLWITS